MRPDHFVGICAAMFLAAWLLWLIIARAIRSVYRTQGVMFFVVTAGFLYLGATKPDLRPVMFPVVDPEAEFLTDTGSVVSNDHVHVEFEASLLLPQSAPIFLEYSDGTNLTVWTTYVSATLATFPRPLDFDFPGAVSNVWMCYTTWTPGPAVHTNGVAQIGWQLPSINEATNVCAMLNTAIYTNSTKVVTQ